MQALYEQVQAWDTKTRKEAWEKWLWGYDCNEVPLEECWDMNHMHCMGVLCCVHEYMAPHPMYQQSLADILPSMTSIHVHERKQICSFTLREVMDQIECMQLNWGQIVGSMRENSLSLVQSIMSRVGFFVLHAFETNKVGLEGFLLDDPQHSCVVPPQGKFSIVSRKSIRQVICTLMALGRVQAIVCRAISVPEQQNVEEVLDALKQHHIEASMDFFNNLQQMMLLAPGMRLVYRTNFSGMYNNVSQVIYFHFPKFCRQAQKELNEVGDSAMHLLPLITELLPDVLVAYDDDSYIGGLTRAENNKRDQERPWTWLVSCGTVFLVQRETGEIFAHDSLAELVAFYLTEDKRTLGGDMEEGDDMEMHARKKKKMHERKNEGCRHGHVDLIGV